VVAICGSSTVACLDVNTVLRRTSEKRNCYPNGKSITATVRNGGEYLPFSDNEHFVWHWRCSRARDCSGLKDNGVIWRSQRNLDENDTQTVQCIFLCIKIWIYRRGYIDAKVNHLSDGINCGTSHSVNVRAGCGTGGYFANSRGSRVLWGSSDGDGRRYNAAEQRKEDFWYWIHGEKSLGNLLTLELEMSRRSNETCTCIESK